ncbi:glycoside hydrolase family 3 protein [Actinomyces urogenitalis]|uniref:glycoside hydrolase family 3 protein n=1 Tax=Actinomyces urogenitalis TaxID=103621 RepID=UPI00189ACAB2|nr:glycoside hydrolase family 3 protein [Actinomyces urogenitalis]MDK8237677.1 glycoside hydrolase family 3 C-terminal domain-containing protein [Actinomyces urogenitalis]WOO95585.1 glycoside hydrolase family 3 C-terminal domain-containing protein [Actinomyces urogenitalis]
MTTDATASSEEALLSQSSTRSGDVADSRLSPQLARAVRALAARGAVLLRNEDQTLPLQASEPVALLGRVQKDWIAVGYGSGGDVNAPYVTNLLDCLREQGVAVDSELAALYEQWCQANPVDPGTEWGKWPLSFPEMELADDVVAAAAQRARTAVVVIGRAAGEDRESVLEPGSYYLQDAERRLLEQAVRSFERTVAVVVTGNVMDLAWAEELGVDALLLAWCGGMEGGRAIADVLTGAAEPGGRLTDTIARTYEDYPSAGHFGDPEANEYTEDVFVGYRYFETFAPEAVLYPFGFGLGYSQHEITGEGVELTEDGACVAVTAVNTGDLPSSTVVQVYVAKPGGGLSQPVRELAGFGRTEQLAPGEGEEQVIDVPWRDMASYDDSGVTGHRFAWVLPAGTYTFYVGSDVRSAQAAGSVEVEETLVVEQLEQAAAPAADHPFERLARQEDESGTIVRGSEPVPVSEVDLRERILSRLPQALTPAQGEGEPAVRFEDVQAGRASLQDFVVSLSPKDLSCLAYGDVAMDSPLGAKGNAGALGGVTQELRALGVPPSITTDGPSGIRLAATASLLPCGTALASTWDPEAVEEMAALHGEEMAALGSDILLSPGMNIHRDPLCGRSFEYYSEDPLLTGLMGSAVVSGVQSTGRAACPKHFAANNQETNRIFNDSRVSERALREIYLRGFEIVVTEAAPKVLMTSYNKVNGVWAHYHYDLVTTILRREWGYEGLVITDWWMRMAQDPTFPALRDSAYRVRAGVDVLMPGGDKHFSTVRDDAIMDSYGQEEGITLGEMQATAAHVLRFLVS